MVMSTVEGSEETVDHSIVKSDEVSMVAFLVG